MKFVKTDCIPQRGMKEPKEKKIQNNLQVAGQDVSLEGYSALLAFGSLPRLLGGDLLLHRPHALGRGILRVGSLAHDIRQNLIIGSGVRHVVVVDDFIFESRDGLGLLFRLGWKKVKSLGFLLGSPALDDFAVVVTFDPVSFLIVERPPGRQLILGKSPFHFFLAVEVIFAEAILELDKGALLLLLGDDLLLGGFVALDAGVAGSDFVESVSDLHLALAILHFILEFGHLILLDVVLAGFGFKAIEGLLLSLIFEARIVGVAPSVSDALSTTLGLVIIAYKSQWGYEKLEGQLRTHS